MTPRQNRVTPFGELVATPERGLVYANRGCLHDEHGRIRRRYNGKLWIACRLQFKGWHRGELMKPGRFTELFFLDEATAFAAGHRPCALCRREDYNRFREIWAASGLGPVRAVEMDARLHAERVDPDTRAHRLHEAPLDSLPDGAFVVRDGAPWLVLGDHLLRWGFGGYGERLERPGGEDALVITPPSLVQVLRSWSEGAVPVLHPSARS